MIFNINKYNFLRLQFFNYFKNFKNKEEAKSIFRFKPNYGKSDNEFLFHSTYSILAMLIDIMYY
jgi:hypothetical protein